MALWLNQEATGASNGVNVLFDVSTDYQPGSPSVRINGNLCAPAEFSELGGKTLQLSEPPPSGHRVTVRFRTVT